MYITNTLFDAPSIHYSTPIIQRTLYEDILNHLSAKEISLIIGPRQSGKTTVLRGIQSLVEKKGRKVLYLNLDVEKDFELVSSQEKLLQKIRLELGDTPQGAVVCIDEVQRKENAGLFFKGLYDLNLPYKYILTGSGSLELKENISESMAGRKRVFTLSTVRFDEFVHFKTNYVYTGKLQELCQVDQQRMNLLLDEYLQFGGFPKVILAETREEKQRILEELYTSYLQKDLYSLLGIKKTNNMSTLIRVLASDIGKPVEKNELGLIASITPETLHNFLWYLENTFLIHKVLPFFRNFRKEITKMPLFYFLDLGLRNYILDYRANNHDGFVFQNFIYLLLQEMTQHTNTALHYWRTTDGAEVDFVLIKGLEYLPIEVKYSDMINKYGSFTLSRGLQSFIKKYAPKTAYIVHAGEEKSVTINQTTVTAIPYWKLMFMTM